MLVEDIVQEANVEPKSLETLDKWINEMGEDLEYTNPDVDHTAFLKRLKKDIVNNNRIFGAQTQLTALEPYKPKKTDPDFIKNASDVYTVNKKALDYLYDELIELYAPDEDEPTSHALFNKFHELVKSPDTLDANIANKLLPIKKKYEQGKFDLPGLKNAMGIMTTLGAQKWKHDKAEKRRVEAEAPIIMKFKNGMMWVRLDSQEEMKREGDMMQNCLSSYCPIQSIKDVIEDWYRQWEEVDFVAHDDIEEMMEWLTDAVEPPAQETADELDLDIWNMAEMLIDRYEHNKEYGVDQPEAYAGHLIYSLRDKNGEAHISAEYDPQEDMNHMEPTEVLGKQNSPPIAKYQGYVDELNNFFEEHPETFGPKGNTKDMPFHPDYDDDRERDEPSEAVNEGDLIPNPANTIAIKTQSDGDFYNLTKYMGDLDKASPTEFGSPDSAAVITFQDKKEADLVLKRIQKHTGLKGDNIAGYEDPGDSGTWDNEADTEEKPLSLLGHDLKRTPDSIPFNSDDDANQQDLKSDKEEPKWRGKVEPDTAEDETIVNNINRVKQLAGI